MLSIYQYNNPHDPVANGLLNQDGDYQFDFNEPFKHSFRTYYPQVKNELKKINNLDISSMPLVSQGGLGYIMIGKERVLGENESFFNVIGRMEDIQGYIENYNNTKNLLDQNKSR